MLAVHFLTSRKTEVGLQAYTEICSWAQKYCGPIRLQDFKCFVQSKCLRNLSVVG